MHAVNEALEDGEIVDDVALMPKHKRQKLSVPSPPRDIPKAKPRLRVPSPPPVPVPTPKDRQEAKPKRAKGGSNGNAAATAGAGANASNTGNFVNLYGSDARPEVQVVQRGAPITVMDVQALLLWVLAEGNNPKWAFVRNKLLLQRVLLLFVPGIDRDLFEASGHLLPNMHRLLGEPTTVAAKSPTVSPGHTVSQLFTVPHDRKRKREDADRAAAAAEQQGGGSGGGGGAPSGSPVADVPTPSGPAAQFPIRHYVLSYKDMEAHNFPLPFLDDDGSTDCPAGFVSSADPEAVGGTAAGGRTQEGNSDGKSGTRDMVALDCEMCYCGEALEVTRITLLDSAGEVLMDDLVLPDTPITDYNTRYSGITAAMMAGVTRSLADAQRRLFSFMGPDTLLVGHALENDLAALRVLHSRCIDTAALFPHPKGPPYKFALRVLTEKYLKRRIQMGEHDSVQDARAALDLAQLKFRHGPAFGVEPLTTGDRLMDVLAAAGKTAALVDRIEVLNRHTTGTASAIRASGDADAAARAGKAIRQPGTHFVWTQLTQLADMFERRARVKPEPAPPGEEAPGRPDLGNLRERAEAHLSGAQSSAMPANGSAPAPAAGSGSAAAPAVRKPPAPPPAVVAILAAPAAAAAPSAAQLQRSKRAIKSLGAQALEAAAAARPPGAGLQAPLDATLQRLDGLVGQLHAALLPNTLLILHTGQGDTAECRRLQKEKYRRQARLDGLPPWDMASEQRFVELCTRTARGICFCTVKH